MNEVVFRINLSCVCARILKQTVVSCINQYAGSSVEKYDENIILMVVARQRDIDRRFALFWDVTQRRAVIVIRSFDIIYRSHLGGSSFEPYCTLHNIPEKHNFDCCGSLKSRIAQRSVCSHQHDARPHRIYISTSSTVEGHTFQSTCTVCT
jgi:hypothetical protein